MQRRSGRRGSRVGRVVVTVLAAPAGAVVRTTVVIVAVMVVVAVMAVSAAVAVVVGRGVHESTRSGSRIFILFPSSACTISSCCTVSVIGLWRWWLLRMLLLFGDVVVQAGAKHVVGG